MTLWQNTLDVTVNRRFPPPSKTGCKKAENPERCSHPGFLSSSLILGRPTARWCHRGMGTANGQLETGRRGPCRGLGCRTASLTSRKAKMDAAVTIHCALEQRDLYLGICQRGV